VFAKTYSHVRIKQDLKPLEETVMSTKDSIKSQYYASLQMLRQAVTKCPDALWDDRSYKNVFWHVVYHSLFYTHLYLAPTRESFKPWSKSRPGYNEFKEGQEPYSKADILVYFEVVEQQVEEQIGALDPDAPSGFHWLPFNKLELQIYNIRHLQQHAGELYERLGVSNGIEVDWVSLKKGTSE
jgi:hypothetical protein